jgi:CelD/BcsL family acetyltransferase involved in cellulose biosynthesis
MPDVLAAEVLDSLDSLEGVTKPWDELAGLSGRPQMAPAWVRGWLRHLAPDGTEPRVVVVREGEEVVGIAPFFVDAKSGGRVDYRIANIEMWAGLSLLARPGREPEAAAAFASALVGDVNPRPDLVAFEGLPLDSAWPAALRDGWPSRVKPLLRKYTIHPSPSIGMHEDDFEAWFAARSSHFRQHLRRARRKFEKAGGASRRSDPSTLTTDVETFVRLHTSRWEDKEGSSNLVAYGDRLAPMLEEAGRALGPERFRLGILEVDGEPAAANIFVAAGGHILYVNAGWDQRFAKLNPVMLGLLDAVEEAFSRGDEHIDLGLGRQEVKVRFADGDDPVAWTVMIPPGRGLPRAVAGMAPTLVRAALRDSAKRHLSPKAVEKTRGLRNRLAR